MTCMIQRLPGGSPEIFPIPTESMNQLLVRGAQEMSRFANEGSITPTNSDVYVGAALRADRTPFYLSIFGPSLETGQSDKPWTGAFYAPFGVGDVVGSVDARRENNFVTLSVRAQLLVNGEPRVSAEWVVNGSQESMPNKAALIESVNIRNSGPHMAEDIRRCIALHAPQRVLGEPRAIVAMQCGVAVAALIEAIC